MYKYVFFDCDGTLLETLPDIRIATNLALKQCGYDYQFSLKEARVLIGNGADMLVRRALRDKADDPVAFAQLKAAYLPLYKEHQADHAKPFNGIKEICKVLKDAGVRMFVITNKPDALAKEILQLHFGKDLFDEIQGALEGVPVKPDPALLDRVANKYGVDKSEALYVGDALPDAMTAKNAGMDCCLCLWGYGEYKPQLLELTKFQVKKPKELAQIVLR